MAKGVGWVMLEALKNIYLHTACIITFYGCFSETFITRSGIRQGSASSVLLFILFMDGLFPYLREHCSTEELIKHFHALVHADDTIIISTSRDQFITKCNHMLDYFSENSLKLNFDKSSYFIINPKANDRKTSLQLEEGILKYKAKQEYLGVIVTDVGSLKHDILKFIREKRSNILIKFTNFCNKNFLAPLNIKLDVLDTCVTSSLLYASETWADNGKEVEALYRTGLPTALGIRTTVNNEVLYTESGRYPLKCRIQKQQLKFWLSLQNYMSKFPESALKHLLDIAIEHDLPYVKWYQSLESKYRTPENCRRSLETEFKAKWKTSFDRAENDVDSRLGTYHQVNPTLSAPDYINKIMFETDRVMLTRFRCGSHSLFIETGRYSNVPRDRRLCSCGRGTQTVLHCFTDCTTTRHLLQGKLYTNLDEVFNDENVCVLLHKICKELKVPI